MFFLYWQSFVHNWTLASEEQDDQQDDEQDNHLDLEQYDEQDLEHINICIGLILFSNGNPLYTTGIRSTRRSNIMTKMIN